MAVPSTVPIVPVVPVPVKRSILERLPGKLPTAPIPDKVDTEAIAKSIVERLPSLTEDSLTDDALWRDTYALTGTFRTFYFKPTVAQQWSLLNKRRHITSVKYVDGSSRIIPLGPQSSCLECKFQFVTENPRTECLGFLSLVPSLDGSAWKIWVLRTVLEQLPGHGDVDVLEPEASWLSSHSSADPSMRSISHPSSNGTKSNGVDGHIHGDEHGHLNGGNGHMTNGDVSAHDRVVNHTSLSSDSQHFHAVVIGGGQAGLSVGGRLKALGTSYVIVEKNEQVGDAWRTRYQSARRKFVTPLDKTVVILYEPC